jgi:hypothetical protein
LQTIVEKRFFDILFEKFVLSLLGQVVDQPFGDERQSGTYGADATQYESALHMVHCQSDGVTSATSDVAFADQLAALQPNVEQSGLCVASEMGKFSHQSIRNLLTRNAPNYVVNLGQQVIVLLHEHRHRKRVDIFSFREAK